MKYLFLFLMLCGLCSGYTEWIVSAGAAAAADNGGKMGATYVGTTAQFLGTNDGPVDTVTDGVYTDATGVLHLDGAFTHTLVGMGIYIVSGTNMTAGRYIITTRTSDDEVVVDGPTFGAGTGDSTDVHAHIGGAILIGTAATIAADGDRMNIKSGSYSVGATTFNGASDARDYVVYRGFNVSIGDLDSQGRGSNGLLTTTNMPDITATGVLQWNSQSAVMNLDITGALSSTIVGNATSDNLTFINCEITNTQNNAAAECFYGDNTVTLINCDMACTGASHTSAVVSIDSLCIVDGCYFKTAGNAPCLQIETGVVTDSIIVGAAGTSKGIQWNPSALGLCMMKGCVIYNTGTAIEYPNVGAGYPVYIIDSHITDSAVRFQDNLYSGTDTIQSFEINNRTRDNTDDENGMVRVIMGEVTTAGAITDDFDDPANGNFFPKVGAAGLIGARTPYRDIGALNRSASSGSGRVRSPWGF